MVIDLCGKEGFFETDSIGVRVRSFGVWSFKNVTPGDFIIRPVNKTQYTPFIVTSVEPNPFVGSDFNKLFKGVMTQVLYDDVSKHPELLRALQV